MVAHRVVELRGGVAGVVPLWQSDHQNVLHVSTGCGVAVVRSAGGREDVLPAAFHV